MVDSRSNLVGWLLYILLASLIGVMFGLLFQKEVRSYGSGLGWGTAYGILWWFLGPLTLLPARSGQPLDWSSAHAHSQFGFLVGHVLFGALVGLLYAIIGRVCVWFVTETDPIRREPEGLGAITLRALGWGAAASLVGGLVFSVVMVSVGFLPTVASLVGGTSPWLGFAVHLVISTLDRDDLRNHVSPRGAEFWLRHRTCAAFVVERQGAQAVTSVAPYTRPQATSSREVAPAGSTTVLARTEATKAVRNRGARTLAFRVGCRCAVAHRARIKTIRTRQRTSSMSLRIPKSEFPEDRVGTTSFRYRDLAGCITVTWSPPECAIGCEPPLWPNLLGSLGRLASPTLFGPAKLWVMSHATRPRFGLTRPICNYSQPEILKGVLSFGEPQECGNGLRPPEHACCTCRPTLRT
jgi:hypothetical protein